MNYNLTTKTNTLKVLTKIKNGKWKAFNTDLILCNTRNSSNQIITLKINIMMKDMNFDFII